MVLELLDEKKPENSEPLQATVSVTGETVEDLKVGTLCYCNIAGEAYDRDVALFEYRYS